MAIAIIMEQPKTPQDLAEWAFAHAAHHFDINQAIFRNYGVLIEAWVLNPFNLRDMQVWLYQHQLMHSAQNDVLGIASHNLTNVNWAEDDPEDLALWFRQHGSEHYQAGQILDLG